MTFQTNEVPKANFWRSPEVVKREGQMHKALKDPEGNVVAGEIGIVTQQDLESYIAQKKG